ncbi:mitochondrial ribonuclease P catalytic subunit [Epargyreus clarus]|uniref:mitochondrial ribonuclease P catalytic subunit n=1 Tax=Epargyreus clarus TaxID=520877 RepID=UPI003C2F1848
MRLIYKSFSSFSRRLFTSSSHVTLAPKYVTEQKEASPPRENLQLKYLIEVIEKNDSDWKTVKNNILSKQGSMTEKNVDALIIKFITSQKKYDSAYSFINYLKATGTDLNLGVTNGLLNMYYEFSKENELSEDARKFILDSYKNLYDKYKMLDYFTCERLLHALCVIDEWKKCMKILDDIHLSSTPSHSTYSTLIATLFKNNKKAEAFKLIQRSLNDRRLLQDKAYDEWIKFILRKYKEKKTILKYLDELCQHLAHNYIKVTESTAERIRETYLSLDWSARYTSVKRESGECNCCKEKLDDIILSDKEFSLLQQNVKDKLIVGSDLFLKTSPGELERFLRFIEKTKPYDVVLDGLNIIYLIGAKHGSPMEKLKTLSMVVDHFLKQNKKILLLGRKHMFKWHGPTLKELTQKTCSFFTENITQDDPYFITAAILSGAHTDIVSRDLLRGHRFLMKDEKLRLLFQKWQWKHQWMVLPARKRPQLQPPLKFSPCAQKNALGWHIPYEKKVETDDNYFNNGDPDCSAWLCLKEKSR